RLLSRCTVIWSQWVLATPAGSHGVLGQYGMTKGWYHEAQPPSAASTYLEVTPAVPVLIRQDFSDRRRILCPDHGGFLLLRVPVPHLFVQHRPDGVAFGEPERHPVRCQAMRAGMHHSRQMSHGVSPCSMHDDRASMGARNTHWLAVCVMSMRYDAGLAVNRPARAAPGAWPGVARVCLRRRRADALVEPSRGS